MLLQLIRNATLKLSFGGRTILVDPYFAARHALESFAGKSRNPLVDLPVPVEQILDGVDLVIVSHLHSDHFDGEAQRLVPKHLPVLCQPGEEDIIRSYGFTDVKPLARAAQMGDVTITPREGSHGLGPVVDDMGPVIGFTLEALGEPKLYWAGDTVLYPPVRETITAFQPDVIVTHSCGALWDGSLIVMDANETIATAQARPAARVIAVHMEALDHATVSRADLRAAAQAASIAEDRLLIPGDGEAIEIRAG